MLNALFFVNENGEILLQKEFLPLRNDWNADAFVRILKQNKDLAPCVLLKDIYYFHQTCDKIRLVAVTENKNASPIIICEYLERIGELLKTFLGSLSADAIRSNIGLVYEVICETNDAGCPKLMEVSKLKPLLCNAVKTQKNKSTDYLNFLPDNLFGVVEKEKREASSESSQKPLLSSKTEKADELYVDLIEKLSIIINADGSISMCNILGRLSIKSYLDNNAVVTLGFPEAEHSFSKVVFHPTVDAQENKLPKSLALTVSPGNLEVMSYTVSTLGKDISLPFTMYVDATADPVEKMITLKLKIYCSLPIKHPAVNVKGKIPIPNSTLTVSGFSSLKNVAFHLEKNLNEYHFTCPLFPGSSHHTINAKIFLSSWTPTIPFEIANIVLQFEVPMLCHSDLRITGLKVERVNTISAFNNIEKWVRYLSFSRSYEFRINDDWFRMQID